MKNLAIITARGGSKRIPRKNIRDFLGKPIIAYSIKAALKSGVFDTALLMPLDFYFFIKRFINFYKPSKLFIVEADLWPNLVIASANNSVPVFVINGRLSKRSFKRYKNK